MSARKIYIKIIISYLLILLIAVSANLIYYKKSIELIKIQTDRVYEKVFEVFQANLYEKTKQIKNIVAYFAWNPKYKWLLNLDEQISSNDIYYLTENIKSIRNYNKYINKIYFYMSGDSDIALPADYFSKDVSLENIAENYLSDGFYYIMHNKYKKLFYYIEKLKIPQCSIEDNVFIVAFIDEKLFLDVFMDILQISNANSVLSDENGNIILSINADENISDNRSYKKYRFDLHEIDWHLIFDVPLVNYEHNINLLLRLILYSIAVSFVITTAVIAFLVKKDIIPINTILMRNKILYLKNIIIGRKDRLNLKDNDFALFDNPESGYHVLLFTPHVIGDNYFTNLKKALISLLELKRKEYEFLVINQNLVMIIEVPESKKDGDYIDKLLQKIEYAELDYYLSVSKQYYEYSNIDTAYRETLFAVDHNLLFEKKKVMKYDNIVYEERKSINPVLKKESKIINYLNNFDFNSAEDEFFKVIDNNFKKDSDLKYLKFRIVNILIEYVINNQDFNSDKAELFLNKIYKINETDRIAGLKEIISALLVDLDKSGDNGRDRYKGDIICEKAENIVSGNIANRNLSVGMIADELKLSSQYLSMIYRKYRKEGLLDFIHSMRIDKAKDLLLNRDLNIKDVSELTGFFNTNTFIRVFKKNEGISPGKYKKFS